MLKYGILEKQVTYMHSLALVTRGLRPGKAARGFPQIPNLPWTLTFKKKLYNQKYSEAFLLLETFSSRILFLFLFFFFNIGGF